MNQNWAGSPTGHDGFYSTHEGWGFPAQVYQQTLNEAAALNEDQSQLSVAPNEFDRFEELFQFDGQADQEDAHQDQYEDQANVGDIQDDGQVNQEDNQDEN